MSKSIKYGALAAILLLIGFMVYESFSQPGIEDLQGEYTEVAVYRNENNTGPIVRIYAVTTPEERWEEMKQYGDFMPHTKYGITKVYFFRKGQPVPSELRPGDENFEAMYRTSCLGKYEKDGMGNVKFEKY